MISKNLSKLIRQLDTKKGRLKEQCFVAEGPKVVGDLLETMCPQRLIATSEWWSQSGLVLRDNDLVVTSDELRKVSFLQHPQQVLALFPIPCMDFSHVEQAVQDSLVLALDGVQDPGNLGTIIRLADWFGIDTLVCSLDTVDAYNPKVVQATMGSLGRVNIFYENLPSFLSSLPPDTPVFGTFLDGQNIYAQSLSRHGVIIMGNEGQGISFDVAPFVTQKLFIPSFPIDRPTAESLNVAIATAITCAEFRRREY